MFLLFSFLLSSITNNFLDCLDYSKKTIICCKITHFLNFKVSFLFLLHLLGWHYNQTKMIATKTRNNGDTELP